MDCLVALAPRHDGSYPPAGPRCPRLQGISKAADYAVACHRAAPCADPLGSNPPHELARFIIIVESVRSAEVRYAAKADIRVVSRSAKQRHCPLSSGAVGRYYCTRFQVLVRSVTGGGYDRSQVVDQGA
jgi:hypothetical protein